MARVVQSEVLRDIDNRHGSVGFLARDLDIRERGGGGGVRILGGEIKPLSPSSIPFLPFLLSSLSPPPQHDHLNKRSDTRQGHKEGSEIDGRRRRRRWAQLKRRPNWLHCCFSGYFFELWFPWNLLLCFFLGGGKGENNFGEIDHEQEWE